MQDAAAVAIRSPDGNRPAAAQSKDYGNFSVAEQNAAKQEKSYSIVYCRSARKRMKSVSAAG